MKKPVLQLLTLKKLLKHWMTIFQVIVMPWREENFHDFKFKFEPLWADGEFQSFKVRDDARGRVAEKNEARIEKCVPANLGSNPELLTTE